MKKPPVCYFCGRRHWFVYFWGPLLLKVLVVLAVLAMAVLIVLMFVAG